MNITMKCLPTGDLPYNKITLTTNMMVRLFENSPFLALLPNISRDDNIIFRTLGQSDLFKYNKKKFLLNINTTGSNDDLTLLNMVYNNPNSENLEHYEINSVFIQKYFKFIERVKPEETVVNLLGPFTFALTIDNFETEDLLLNNILRKFLIQFFSVKAMWIADKIKEISPNTKVLIIFEEQKLKDFSILKKNSEKINNETLVSIYRKIIKKIQSNGFYVGIQCFEKCNWAIPIDAGVDLISFDAYNNPSNLNVIPKKIDNYMRNGGYINWGIVPVTNEQIVKSLNIDTITENYKKITNELIKVGVSADMLYSHSTVSIQGNTSDLPVLFAERAIILAHQLSQRISAMK